MIGGYPALLACTVASEALVVVILATALEARTLSLREAARSAVRAAGAWCLLNLLTHPLAYLTVMPAAAPFALVEAAVVAAEAIGYRGLAGRGWLRAVALSLAANGVTIALSLGCWWC